MLLSRAKISPIFYMGNKKRLINKGLTKLFPKDIDTFYDLFGGSGVVALNVEANKYILNELDNNVYGLYKTLKETSPEDIVKHIENRIDEYDLPKMNTHSSKTTKEVRDFYKERYMKFRNHYNTYKNPLDLFVLMNYCMSQTIRFNQSGGFNMPFGSDYFIKEKHTQRFIDFHEMLNMDNFTISNKSYIDYNPAFYNKNDFIYLDPPYMNTIATYNENGKWTSEQQDLLLNYCLYIIKSGRRFAMSNVFKNRDFINTDLIEWCNENGLNVYTFEGFNYSNFGKASSESKEVLITNYEIEEEFNEQQ